MILRLACLAAALTAGCYDPDLRDCTVTCTVASECAGDQTCTGGFCVGEQTTSCAADRQDAAVAEKVDAMKTPPPTMVMLHVTVNGKGVVKVDNDALETCAAIGNNADCMWSVSSGSAHVLTESPEMGRSFMMWTGACSGSATSCTLTPTMDTTVGAMFNN